MATSSDGNTFSTANILSGIANSKWYSLQANTNLILAVNSSGGIIYGSNDLGNTWSNATSAGNISGNVPIYERNRQTITFYAITISGTARLQVPAINLYDTTGNISSSASNGYYQYLGGSNNISGGLFVKTSDL